MTASGEVMLERSGTATTFGRLNEPSATFRFCDLPGELRHDVYCRYFGSWDAVVEYNRKTASFRIHGLPVYSLMLTSHATHLECKHLISESFSGRLILRDLKIRRERGFGFTSSLDVISSLCPLWMLRRTKTLTLEQGTSGMLVMLPWNRMQLLREVQLEGSNWPGTHCYPCGLSLEAQKAQEKHILEGKYDSWCTQGYKSWSHIPEPVAEGQVRVITVRQGSIKGEFLKVRIEHKANHVEILDRSINFIIQPKDLEKDDRTASQQLGGSCQPM